MGRRLDSFVLHLPQRRVGPDLVHMPARARTVGYAPGVFDLFHVGHLNLLQRAAASCDYLVAGVVSDQVALLQKGRPPVVPEAERLAIVAGMRSVDRAYLQRDLDKVITWSSLRFDVVFKGDDWKGTEAGDNLERAFAAVQVRVVYLPYTEHTSTTQLRELRLAATS